VGSIAFSHAFDVITKHKKITKRLFIQRFYCFFFKSKW